MGSQELLTNVQIPVIDVSSRNPEAAQQLLSAACRFGFVFVANNYDREAGVDPSCIAQMFELSREFFALPAEVKQQVSISSNKAGKNFGWLSQGVEKLDPKTQVRADVKEAFNMSEPTPNGTFDQPLPDLLQDRLSLLLKFHSSCHNLCSLLLTHFATALSLPGDWFATRHDRAAGPSGTIFRMLYYPQRTSSNDAATDIRAGAHSDYGSLTCLFQVPGQPGLEIKTPSGEWAAVPVDPDPSHGDEMKPLPILVNIGDLLEDWTSGLLKSTVHRVVFPKCEAGDRYSLAYFCHPNDDAVLEAVPSQLVEEHARTQSGRSGRKAGITAREHLMERLAATYTV